MTDIVEILENSTENIYLTGVGGTGKSTAIRKFVRSTRKKVVVCAPTGRAALNAGGQTAHSLFRLPPHVMSMEDIITSAKRQGDVTKYCDILLMDEISMFRADMIDNIDQIMQISRRNRGVPFGGATVIAVGDHHQLPPIIRDDESEHFFSKYVTPYFFSSKVFTESPLKIKELMTVFRQRDQLFIDILNSIRDGSITDYALQALNTRCCKIEAPPGSGMVLTPYNATADKINKDAMDRIPGKSREFTATVTGEFPDSQKPADTKLTLKVGAPVMFIKNHGNDWVNGTLGTVTNLDPLMVQIDGKASPVSVQAETWDILKHEMYDDTDENGVASRKIRHACVGSFTQVPLKIGAAGTIHKIQGASLDKGVIDLGKGSFDFGQTYVALSRFRSLEGVTLLKPFTRKDIQVDQRVIEFMKSAEGAGLVEHVYQERDDEPNAPVKRVDLPEDIFGEANALGEELSEKEYLAMQRLLMSQGNDDSIRKCLTLCWDRIWKSLQEKKEMAKLLTQPEPTFNAGTLPAGSRGYITAIKPIELENLAASVARTTLIDYDKEPF
jgi:ATP-dependent DNA helicase PIF1